MLLQRKETNEQASYEYRVQKYRISRCCSIVGIVHYSSSHSCTITIDLVCSSSSSVLLFADIRHLPYSFPSKKNEKNAARMANNMEETNLATLKI
jgi:hypothetical protein